MSILKDDKIQEAYEKTILENASSKKALMAKIGNLLASEIDYGVITRDEYEKVIDAIKKILKA